MSKTLVTSLHRYIVISLLAVAQEVDSVVSCLPLTYLLLTSYLPQLPAKGNMSCAPLLLSLRLSVVICRKRSTRPEISVACSAKPAKPSFAKPSRDIFPHADLADLISRFPFVEVAPKDPRRFALIFSSSSYPREASSLNYGDTQ